MGEAEIITGSQQIILSSHLVTYGDAADPGITERIREEIESLWNEVAGVVIIRKETFRLQFLISAGV